MGCHVKKIKASVIMGCNVNKIKKDVCHNGLTCQKMNIIL